MHRVPHATGQCPRPASGAALAALRGYFEGEPPASAFAASFDPSPPVGSGGRPVEVGPPDVLGDGSTVLPGAVPPMALPASVGLEVMDPLGASAVVAGADGGGDDGAAGAVEVVDDGAGLAGGVRESQAAVSIAPAQSAKMRFVRILGAPDEVEWKTSRASHVSLPRRRPLRQAMAAESTVGRTPTGHGGFMSQCALPKRSIPPIVFACRMQHRSGARMRAVADRQESARMFPFRRCTRAWT